MFTLLKKCNLILGDKQNGTMLSMIGHTLVAMGYSEAVSNAFFKKYQAANVWAIRVDNNSSQDKVTKSEFAQKFLPASGDLAGIYIELAHDTKADVAVQE